jgi:hypothetical protein
MTFGQIVIDRDLMSCVEKFFRANGTDVACAAGDEYVHADSLENFRAGKSEKAVTRVKTRRRLENERRFLEPALLALDVGLDEIFVGLGQVDDAFDQTDDTADTKETKDDLNDTFLCVTEVEFVDAKATQQNGKDAGHNFLF